jgi:hypothetical protein
MNCYAKLLLVLAPLLASVPVGAETIHALRDDATLLVFDSGTPGTIAASIPVTGLVGGDVLESIDIRPANGLLYGIGVNNPATTLNLYRIDTVTGVATRIGSSPVSYAPASAIWGMDFNPTVDRVRVINGARANFRLHPETGAMVDGDTIAAGVQQDTNLSGVQTITDLAYDRSFAGATVSTAYAINYTADQLVRIGGIDGSPTPNLGVLTTVGPLGIVQQVQTGAFDISGQTLHLIARVGGITNLYTVDYMTGAATLVGAVAGNPLITGMAVDGSIRAVGLSDGAGGAAASLLEGDRDYYGVAVPAGGRLWALADSGGPRNDATASRITSMRLLQPNLQTEIEQDRGDGTASGEDDTQEGGDAGLIAGRTLANAGQYFLEVSEGYLVASNDDDPVAPYKLSVAVTTAAPIAEMEPNETAATATPIGTFGGVLLRSATTSAADEDWFQFSASAGDVVMVVADGNPTRDPNNLTQVNIDLQLRGPSPFNEILRSSANSETPNDPNEIGEGFVFHVFRSGTYYVRVDGAATGDYDLMVKTVRRFAASDETAAANDSAATAQALARTYAATSVAGGALSVGGDNDYYRFAAVAGARVWAFIDTGGPLNQSSGVSQDSVLTLYDVNGTTAIEVDGTMAPATAATTPTPATASPR